MSEDDLELTDKEIRECREMLDSLAAVAESDDTIANVIEYNGTEVVITTYPYVNPAVRELLQDSPGEDESDG